MRTLIAVTALIAAAPLAAQDADKVTLKWKLAKDQVVRYEVSQRSKVDSDMISWDMSSTFVFGCTVKSVDENGEATCTVTHETVKFKMTGFAETEYDSTKDKSAPDDPVGQAVAKILGTSFTMKMTPAGAVTSVSGYDKIQEQMIEVMGDGTEMAQGVVRQLFNDAAQRALLQQAFVQLPAEPVAKGAAWDAKHTMDMGLLGTFEFKNACKLTDVKGDEAAIECTTTVGVAEGSGGSMKVGDNKGKTTGTFNAARGLLAASKGNVEIKLDAGESQFEVSLEASLKLLPEKK